jgi:flagellar biosynthetic protein FliP
MNQAALPILTEAVKGTEIATAIEILFLLTLLSVGPIILITLTSFTRIVVVLSFLRQALGTQQSPSNQIIIALALFLSLYVMAPVWQQVEAGAVMPYLQRQIGPQEALAQAWGPLREFLLKQTRKADLALFVEMQAEKAVPSIDPGQALGGVEGPVGGSEELRAKGLASDSRPSALDPEPLALSPEPSATALIPAFMISELKTAFQIAFLIYVPFLILDLVVASVLLSMGMMFLPPVLVSLPFKLVLFVLVDGWNLLVSSLVRSFT